jgi:hypothetical protein
MVDATANTKENGQLSPRLSPGDFRTENWHREASQVDKLEVTNLRVSNLSASISVSTEYTAIPRVMMYLNPHRLHDDRIARIWDLQRLGPDFPLAWLERPVGPIESLTLDAEESNESTASVSAVSLE